uniref:TERF1-interacting nuclear factor 2 N-terminal domain-containing protein n=1 Tax=Gadus morhua TaxID=8049 RepID=A0A8C4ZMJ2_GADMO
AQHTWTNVSPLLAPPVRLVSAAVWKVLKQRDVARYGVVEEFVTSVCESVPGMLTFRHQGKLTLGLRGRKKDLKIERTVNSFHELVETLLQDPAERLQFFKEEFPEEYGPKFDEELEKLLWEFLIRLDQLLPVPNLAQTVSWLSTAPPVLEECAQAATQPQLLKTILQYQTCLGRLERFNRDCREPKPKFLSPNSFSTMAEITPCTSLCCGSSRESENQTQSLRFIISENIPVSSAAAQSMNKDRKHVGRKKNIYFDRCARRYYLTTSLMTNV